MKRLLFLAFLAVSLVSCASCSKNSATTTSNNNTNPTADKMKVKIGNSTFTATLYDNATATAFKSLLPLTVSMVEHNGNEKYCGFPRSVNAISTFMKLLEERKSKGINDKLGKEIIISSDTSDKYEQGRKTLGSTY
jgi:hypothetical protein